MKRAVLTGSLRPCFAATVLLLSACGGGGGDARDAVTTVTSPATPTPAPTPAPSPTLTPSPTPTPSPSPSPSPGPSAVAVTPYTVGTVRYDLAADTPADKVAAIRDAMDFAIAQTNALAAFDGTVSVVYSASTPTADASFRGQIRFGGAISRRVALHELAHWLGIGTVREWGAMVQDGVFTGPLATARVQAFDGSDARLHGDRAHMWPYGLNFDGEWREPQRTTQMVSAVVADMGIGPDAAAAVAGARRFQNRSSALLLSAGAAAPILAAASDAATWQVGYRDGFVTLADGAGAMLEATATGDDAATRLAAPSGASSQSWEMIPVGDGGWFLLRNRATGNCLDTIGNGAVGAAVRLWGCGGHPNQQWQLVR